MQKKIYSIALVLLVCFFFPQKKLFAKTYNPLIKTWINQADQTLGLFKGFTVSPQKDETESTVTQCPKGLWTSFSKSFLSYDNFIGDWGDLFRNDCLREDIWALENKLHELNQIGTEQAINCNADLDELKNAYETLDQHIRGLRRYGENAEKEENESQGCPNCEKAKIVGENNLQFTYSVDLYQDDVCELSRANSAEWKKEWKKFQESVNFFKNMKTIWAEGKIKTGQQWSFSETDYAKAQKKADSWWKKTWNAFYGYKGRQLSFRHLRDGEDSLFNSSRVKNLGKNAGKAVSNVLPSPTVKEVVEENKNQSRTYEELLKNAEKTIQDQDLAEWKSQLDYKYAIHRDVKIDLENYLIRMNNSIKILIDPKNPIIKKYYERLKYVAENHCSNLYGPCKE